MEPQAPQGPSPEAAPAPSPAEQSPDQSPAAPEAAPAAPTPEKQTGAREGVNQGPAIQLPPTPQPTAITTTDDQTPAAPTGSKSAVVQNAPPVADDVDVIEKEWVDKAKEIVEKTKDDPHEQNKEVNALKADYMKKRYGKDVKVSDN